MADNAVKYMPEGRRIWLSVRAGLQEAEAEVQDPDIGISAEDLPHVFDRFRRADKVRTRKLGGTCLGLAIARSVEVRHGGTVTATNRPGGGSTFTVRLPFARDLQTAEDPLIRVTRPKSGGLSAVGGPPPPSGSSASSHGRGDTRSPAGGAPDRDCLGGRQMLCRRGQRRI